MTYLVVSISDDIAWIMRWIKKNARGNVFDLYRSSNRHLPRGTEEKRRNLRDDFLSSTWKWDLSNTKQRDNRTTATLVCSLSPNSVESRNSCSSCRILTTVIRTKQNVSLRYINICSNDVFPSYEIVLLQLLCSKLYLGLPTAGFAYLKSAVLVTHPKGHKSVTRFP
jgi:hypothetical protein